MTRVCVVDDQALVRQGLSSLLALMADVTVVGEAADGAEAVEMVICCRPDVLVLDVRLPIRSGPDVVRVLAERGALPPTLLLTTFDDDESLLQGILAGARGYLRKDVSFDQFAGAIRTLAAGGTVIHPAASARLARGAAVRDAPPRVHLTPRELDVLRLMARGWSNREIGAVLGVTEGTIKNHVSVVLEKMRTRDRTRAVLRGMELGWL